MIADHGKMNDELATLAKAKGVEPPSDADLASQAKAVAEERPSGTTFDRQYVSSQLDDHKETLALFEKEVQSGQDPELKALAERASRSSSSTSPSSRSCSRCRSCSSTD